MLTIIVILAVIYFAYRLLKPNTYSNNPYASGGFGRPGLGGMFGGMILGYLLTHYLIDQNQYDMWRNLNDDQLRDTLISQGVLNETDFDHLAGQASAGMLPYDENSGNTGWINANKDYSDTTDYNDNNTDFGGNDFDGFDGFDQ